MLKFLKKIFEPKPGTERWFKKATRAEVLAFRDALQKIFMDPNQDSILREQIHRYLPYLDRIISKKK